MEIKKELVNESKYDYKCPYPMTPQGITVHNTANDASARNEASYMKSNNNEVSFHIAVDDIEAVQLIDLNRNAWHAGDGGNGFGNRKTIAIEICYSKSGGNKFIKAEKNAAIIVAKLLKQFGWGFDKVYTHQKHSGKYCPHRTLDLGWDRFMNMVKKAYNGTVSTPSSSSSELYRVRKSWNDAASQKGAYSILDNAITEAKKHSGYKVYDSKGNQVYPEVVQSGSSYAENRTFYFDTTVKIRTAPNLEDNTFTGICYDKGESVIYHTVHLNKCGYNWIQYNRNNGTQGFCAITNLATGEKHGYAV